MGGFWVSKECGRAALEVSMPSVIDTSDADLRREAETGDISDEGGSPTAPRTTAPERAQTPPALGAVTHDLRLGS